MDHAEGAATAELRSPARSRLAEELVDILADAVLDGLYPPGSTLPPERELALLLSVNRTSLRQALGRLEQAGLLETRQGVGTVVREPTALTDAGLVARMVRRLGSGLLAEVLEVRDWLGRLVARLAAERGTETDLDAARTALARFESAPDAAGRQAAELSFFDALVAATGNRALRVLMSWLEEVYRPAAGDFVAAFERPDELVPGLRRVLRAVATGRPQAAERAAADYLAVNARRFVAAVEEA